MEQHTLAGADDGQVLVSFTLDKEVFAVDVAQVREILDRTDTTRIPRMPAYMRGALNVRGAVVPVIDLRVKFGLPAVAPTVDTCVMVLEVEVEGQQTVIGALVDSVRDVFEAAREDFTPPPKMGSKLDAEFIRSMVRCGEEVLIVLDVDRVLSVDEMIEVRRASEADAPKGRKRT